MQHHRGVKTILSGLCLVLLVTGGLFTIVGSGGGGGDSAPPPEGAVRLFNHLTCVGGNTVGTLAVGGKTMVANSNQWSPCRFYAPGSYNARATLSTGRCGTWAWNNLANTNVANDCTEVYRIEIRNKIPFMTVNRACPGDCVGTSSLDTESADTGEEIAIEGTLVDEPDAGYSFEE